MESLYNNPITNKSKVKKIKKEITQEEINTAIDKFLKQGGTITQLDPPIGYPGFTFETSSVKEQINKNLDPR